ncbi:MAG TPA: hypothetical protein VIG61_04780 [Fusobacterium sp.]|uniref:hypothetical protein n=1 Tax=Fusobacterium sp. TaxID=68766 RepID=UPI002F3EF54D
MITEKEYFLLALLSYCDFSKKHIGKNLWKIWEEEQEKKTFRTSFILLHAKFHSQFLSFFEEELKKWFIIQIDNRKARKVSSSQSGFFSVCFGNIKQEYVLSYRGSEIFPLEDAYQDFINTDLAIGLGKIPAQFHEGVEVLENLVQSLGLRYEQISLTGHSLGGGIAQYVALSIHRLHQYIPKTYTWNAVGVNKKGIVHIGEFLNLQEILQNVSSLTKEQKYQLEEFNEEYQEFFSREYQKMKETRKEQLLLDAAFFKRLYSQTRIETYFKFLSKTQQEQLIQQDHFWEKLFDVQNFYQKIKDGELFINKIKKNTEYQKKIINYGHSEDLTNSLFSHIGKQYFVDKKLSSIRSSKRNFLEKIPFLKKSLSSCHCENVFLPFFGEGSSLQKKLSLHYISAAARKLIQQEKLFSKEFLAAYYSREELSGITLGKYRQELIEAFRKYQKILYSRQIIEQLESFSSEEMEEFWQAFLKRMASPYRYLDVFDILVYEYK